MQATAPSRPDLARRLPADAYYHLVRTLCLALPPPLSGDPDDVARRNHAAIAAVAALVPANAAEAILAADFVAASEQGRDCLRLAQLPETTPEMAAKCRAEARSMMREAKSAVRLLVKLQEARGKREADGVACNRAAWTEHCAVGLMAEALPAQPMPAAVAQPPAPPPAPEPQPEPEPMLEPEFEPIDEAEHYALIYPQRAALIRRFGRMPSNASFGPPDDDLMQALITARTPDFAALDREYAQACPVPRHGARAA